MRRLSRLLALGKVPEAGGMALLEVPNRAERERLMFFGQTSNWLKQVREVTHNGEASVPHIASQYVDGTNAVRVHCGSEMHVQLRVEFYMTSDEDLAQLDQFLNSSACRAMDSRSRIPVKRTRPLIRRMLPARTRTARHRCLYQLRRPSNGSCHPFLCISPRSGCTSAGGWPLDSWAVARRGFL